MKTGKIVAFIVLAVGAVAALRWLPLRDWVVELERFVASLGSVGPLAWAVIYVAATVLLVPGSALTIGAGGLFGLRTGFVVVLAGANLGALCAFFLARTFLRDQVARWVAGNPKFRSLDRSIGEQGFKMVLLTRLSPVFPFVLLNYALGLTAVRTGPYVAANLLGMLPASFLFVYIGAAARDAITGGTGVSGGFYGQVVKYLGLAATFAVVALVTRMARRAMREAAIESGPNAGFILDERNHTPTRVEAMVRLDDVSDRKLIENCHPSGWVNPTPSGTYNLVVIGAGTAGLVTAAAAAAVGAKVALIERALMGGDCLNVGCVPSKGLIRAARAAFDARKGSEFGLRFESKPTVDFSMAMARMRRVRAAISEHDSARRFRGLGVDVFMGDGRFVGPSTVAVEGKRLEFDRAVIATGARAAELPIPGLAEVGYHTNETIFTLTELPRRIAVIGAGPIGCELAQAFARFGSDVYLIEALHGVLPNEDPDAAEFVRRSMLVRDGIKLMCCGKALAASKSEENGKRLAVDSHENHYDLVVDEILVGGGRTPNLEGLGLEEAGVQYTREGVQVDDRLRTTNPRIYAAGDVCSKYKFTHAADAMARIVIANALFHARRKVSDLVIPWCTYTDPEVAHVGYYEKDARAAGFDVATITEPLERVDRAVLDGENEGFARVHYDRKTGKILGATLVARHAGEMIGTLTLAMVTRQKLSVLSSTIQPYPTQAEALRKIGDAYMRTKLTPTVKKLMGKWLAWRR